MTKAKRLLCFLVAFMMVLTIVPINAIVYAVSETVEASDTTGTEPNNPEKYPMIEDAELPSASVSTLPSQSISEYKVYDLVNEKYLGDGEGTLNPQVLMEFIAKDTAQSAKENAYADYIVDFYVSVDGLTKATLGKGCYLIGHYEGYGWVAVPLDSMTIENTTYPIITKVGHEFTYADICESVVDFKCGIYFTDEFIAANPNMEVSLELGLSKNLNDAQSAKYIKVGETYTYNANDLGLPSATVSTLPSQSITGYEVFDIINKKYLGKNEGTLIPQVLMEFVAKDTAQSAKENMFSDYIVDFYVTVDGLAKTTAGTGCYLIGHYEGYGWVAVPLDSMDVANGTYSIITSVGHKFTYADICTSVVDFKCGIYFSDEFIAANPDMKVSLELGLSKTLEDAQNHIYTTTGEKYTYDVEDLTSDSPVIIPDTLTGAVVEEIRDNIALDNYVPENVPAGAELVIELVSVGSTIVYDVTPVTEAGDKVDNLEKAIIFRLPVPASVTESYAKVYHDGEYIGTYAINGTGNAKYVEVSSADFSEFALEPTNEAPAATVNGVEYATLGEALAALKDGETLVILQSFTANAEEFLMLNGKKNVTVTAAKGVVITGDIQIGYHSSHSILEAGVDRSNSTLTISGLTVNGTLVVLSNDANLVVENNKAAQITVKTYDMNGMNITIDGNIADGSMGTAKNSYGMYLVPNASNYNLVVSNNTFKNVISHAFVVQGTGDGNAVTAANSIAVTGNTFESWGLGGSNNRAAFKIWGDTKYAPASSDLNGTTNAMRELVVSIAAGGNTYLSTASNTVEFDAYGASGNAEDFPAPASPYVAQIGDKKFETLAEAIQAANANDTIEIIVSELVFDENAASIVIDKAIIIKGAGKTATTLKFNSATSAFVIQSSGVSFSDMTIVQGTKDNSFHISISKGAWDAPAINYSNITIKNIDFVGGDYALCLIGENVTVDSCTFNEQDSHNIIIYSVKGETSITNNIFNASKGSNKSAILYEGGVSTTLTGDALAAFVGGGTLTISGNEANSKGVFFQFTNWGLVKDMSVAITGNTVDAFTNKAIAIYTENASVAKGDEFKSFVVTENVFTNVPSGRPILKEYTGTVAVNASANYLGSAEPDYKTLLAGDKVSVESYYADEALSNLVSTVVYVAQIGEKKFETVADALAYAKNEGMAEVTITIIGENTKETADIFNLYCVKAFDKVTFKQDNGNKPYYFVDLCTGSRTNDGEFVFDGVNLVIVEQYIFEGNVRLTNNSFIKSTTESNCFYYYSVTTIEPGSKIQGVIEDFRGGTVIVNGGRTDGEFNTEPSFQDAIVVIRWSGDSLTIKNGAYVKINAANEVGRLTINAGASLNIAASKLDVVQWIDVLGTLNIDVNSLITVPKITGNGTIIIDASALKNGSAKIINADMSEFTGKIEVINNPYATATADTSGVIVNYCEPVVSVTDTEGNVEYFETLEEAFAAAQAGDVVKLLGDVTFDGTLVATAGIIFNGNNFVVNGTIQAGGDITFAGVNVLKSFNPGWYNNTITIGVGASLKVTSGRVTISYGNVFNIEGNVTDAKNTDKSTLTPSLNFVSGISMNGDGSGVEFNVKNAYVVLGDSSSKNSGATGEFNFNFENSIVEFTKTLKTYLPTVGGLNPSFNINAKDSVITVASHMELWNNNVNFVIDNSNVTVAGSFANAGAVTVKNNSNFVVKAPIMSSHGGNTTTGVITVDGGKFELVDSNENWKNEGAIIVNGGELVLNDFTCVAGGKFTVTGGIVIANNGFGFEEGAVVEITGGTFSCDPSAYVADGYVSIKNFDNMYVVGKKPSATVNNLGSMSIPAGTYGVWDGKNYTGKVDVDMPLSFVMQFIADQNASDMANSPYADWYGDFVITFSGIENGSFEADGCYLAGYYGSFGWVKVPVDNMIIENGVRYPVMLGVGLGQKYDYICSSVGEFQCALYITPEILAANPNLKVNLELSVIDNSKGQTAASEALSANTSEFRYEVVDDNYTAEEFVKAFAAKIGNKYFTSFKDALAAAQAGDEIELLAPVVVEKGETLTIDKDVTITYTSNVVGEDMFTVNGNLIIENGTITYVNTDTTGNNVTVSTISACPGSTVIVNGGTIENKTVYSTGSYAFAIDLLTNGSLGDVTVTIEGGKVYSDYMAIRQFNNGTACKNTLVVNGGEIYGAKRAIQIHIDNSAAYLTVNGGKVEGGNYSLCLISSTENVSVTGGEFIGEVYYGGAEGFITGGTFDAEPYAGYVADGYKVVENSNGFGVEEKPQINIVFYGKTISVDTYLMVNLYIEKALYDGITDIYAVVKVGDHDAYEVKYGTENWSIGTGKLDAINVKNIAIKEMVDTISVQFFIGNPDDEAADVQASEVLTYSVREYALAVLSSQKTTNEAKQAMYDLLQLGAASQTYFGYKKETLANEGLDAYSAYARTEEENVVPNKQMNIEIGSEFRMGNTLSLDDSLVLNYYFKKFHTEEYKGKLTAKATYTNWKGDLYEINIGSDEFVYSSNSTMIQVKGLSGGDISSDVTLEVYDENGSVIFKSVYSIEVYLTTALNTSSSAYIYQALANYGESMEIYLKQLNGIK